MPSGVERVTTGAMQFGGDWPGLYLRGDDAIQLVSTIRDLRVAIDNRNDPGINASMSRLSALADLIQRDVVEPQC